jgi:hypothetical protein
MHMHRCAQAQNGDVQMSEHSADLQSSLYYVVKSWCPELRFESCRQACGDLMYDPLTDGRPDDDVPRVAGQSNRCGSGNYAQLWQQWIPSVASRSPCDSVCLGCSVLNHQMCMETYLPRSSQAFWKPSRPPTGILPSTSCKWEGVAVSTSHTELQDIPTR